MGGEIIMVESKTSKLAITSLVTPVILWGSGFCLIKLCGTLVNPIPSGWRSDITNLGIWLILASLPAGLGLGIMALVHIKNKQGTLKGKHLAIEGIIISIAFVIITFMIGLITRQT